MVNNVFIEAPVKKVPPDEDPGHPIPDTAVEILSAVQVGEVVATPGNFTWHVVTQDEAKFQSLTTAPEGYRGITYTEMRADFPTTADEVLEASVDVDGVVVRVKMKDKPSTGVLEEDLPPHFFSGVDAS